MTRTAVAPAYQKYGANIIDLDAYRHQPTMESRRYVLVPVEETAPYTPRPRRNHHRVERLNVIHTALNLTAAAVTFLLAAGLLAVV